MEIDRYDSLEAGNSHQIRSQPATHGFSASGPAILSGVSEVWNYAGKTSRTRSPASVGEEEQFHQMAVNWRTRRLNQVDVAAAHAPMDLGM